MGQLAGRENNSAENLKATGTMKKKPLFDIISSFKPCREALLPMLQKVQEEHGFLSEEAMREIAGYTGVPESGVFGVASFYSQFRFAPKGKNKITVCCGTACHVKGGKKILEELKRELKINEGETTPDNKYSLDTVACLGCCALSPCVAVNDSVMPRVRENGIKKLLVGNRK